MNFYTIIWMQVSNIHRTVLFWAFCIPTRVALSLLDTKVTRPYAAIVSARWAIGMQGTHGFFGGPIWWQVDRTNHAALYALFALSGKQELLLLDAAYGALNWLKNT